MLKLLRNFALAGLGLAGVMKLLAWWAVSHAAPGVTAALAPFAQIKYDGIAAGLDGSVTLDKVSLDAGHRVYRADSVVLESPGLFWLFMHAGLGQYTLPAQFGIAVEGLKLPPGAALDPQWLDSETLVPFAAAGCGSAFGSSDYQRMGVAEAGSREHLDYRYDADQHSLDLALHLSATGFANIGVNAELKDYDAAALESSAMWDKVHVEQISAEYTDLDFLRKRNAFCAQRVGSTSPAQFIDRHVAAVQDMLKQKRAEPSTELIQLYRNLVEHGGQASVLSLPSSGFALSAVHGAADDLLRQLNVTARYQDKPPIMFRIAFAPPDAAAPAVAAEPTTPAPPTPVSVPVTAPAPATAAVAAPVPAKLPAAAPTQPAAGPPSVAPQPSPTPAVPPPKPVASVASPAPPAAPPSEPAKPATPAAKPADNLGMHNLDRAEAQLVVPPLAVAPAREKKSAPVPSPLAASAETPPTGSVLAMVWKPSVFEALPDAEPEERGYEVVDNARLGSLLGRYVRVITESGKKISGFIVAVDDVNLHLRVNRESGAATFALTKARIQQVQLPRP